MVQRKRVMRFGTWNVRSLYSAVSVSKWIFRKWDVDTWTESRLAKDRDSWRVIVTAVVSLRIPYNDGNLWTS